MFEDATALNDYFSTQNVQLGAVRATLGPRIRRARVERLHGLNLEVFGRRIAELLGRKQAFSNVTISNWETGRQEPSFAALIAIARLTQLPLRYFAGLGELDDYPVIDWLVPERDADAACLREALAQCGSLPAPARWLVVAQVKSLVGDLYQLTANQRLA